MIGDSAPLAAICNMYLSFEKPYNVFIVSLVWGWNHCIPLILSLEVASYCLEGSLGIQRSRVHPALLPVRRTLDWKETKWKFFNIESATLWTQRLRLRFLNQIFIMLDSLKGLPGTGVSLGDIRRIHSHIEANHQSHWYRFHSLSHPPCLCETEDYQRALMNHGVSVRRR